MMFSVKLLRHDPCKSGFVIIGFFEANGKSLDWPITQLAHKRNHRTRVDSAAQESSQRYFTDHPQLNGFGQSSYYFRASFALVDFQFRRIAQAPIALHFNFPVSKDQIVCGRNFLDPLEGTQRCRHATECQILVDCLGVRLRPLPPKSENRFWLRAENQTVAIEPVEQRLLPDAIAGHEKQALALVPNRKRKHTAQSLQT